ncbi:uncharacterized protein H6S33_005019 [Morchella sextelata]|uniref:uncharacterized protein n=1 Tax=Morchella sextelata TaxID=1174677 RepID=UPI001D04AB1F|nr:uncharacterized protein H6S33_005019 [Morchella sextelata]KAH0605037.1 hypothetical protein H6S33_005019 [Morchella sextelata]
MWVSPSTSSSCNGSSRRDPSQQQGLCPNLRAITPTSPCFSTGNSRELAAELLYFSVQNYIVSGWEWLYLCLVCERDIEDQIKCPCERNFSVQRGVGRRAKQSGEAECSTKDITISYLATRYMREIYCMVGRVVIWMNQ